MMESFAASHPGKKRANNQDAFLKVPSLGLFVVADGMGGHSGGEIASQFAIEAFTEHLSKIQKDPFILEDVIQSASSRIFEYSQSPAQEEVHSMGTTCSACMVRKKENIFIINFAHVGDSRIYYFCDGKVWQLSRDHTLINEHINSGFMTRREAEGKIGKNVLVRSVGIQRTMMIDTMTFRTKKSGYLLLCSDGLSNMVSLEEINKVILKDSSLEEKVDRLIDRANSYGGDDNITAILVGLQQ